MEILGLAFLFVIIIFGFLFFIKLKGETSTKDTTAEYIEPKIASAFTDMFLHTSVKCGEGDRTLKDLFINCMSYDSNQRESCEQDDFLFSNPEDYDPEDANYNFPMDSCDIVREYLKLAGNLTLEKWGRAYYVEAYILNQEDEDNLQDAFQERLGTSINYPIPELGIEECFYDPEGRIRSYRSRFQPLPLLIEGQVILQTGLCH